jgi:hypothetical protein
LVKLELRRRRGIALTPLLESQQVALEPLLQRLEERGDDDPDLVALWRRESARTVARFLAVALAGEERGASRR